jgi:hypothetical protein
MTSSDRLVSSLTDQEVFGILDVVVGELADDSTPEGMSDQLAALAAALDGGVPSADEIAGADAERMAVAARKLAGLLEEAPEATALVGREAADPPRPENASAELLVAAPLVVTACLVLLQLAGHTHFTRSSSGDWSFSYDPSKKAAIDDVLKDIARILADLFKP